MQGRLIETQTLSDQQKLLLDKLTTTVAQQEEKLAMVSEERSTGLSHLQDNVAELAEEVNRLVTASIYNLLGQIYGNSDNIHSDTGLSPALMLRARCATVSDRVRALFEFTKYF